MSERIEDLRQRFREQIDEATIAEGSVLEAIRNGQFDRARSAIDAAEAAWQRQAELRDELVEIVDAGPAPE